MFIGLAKADVMLYLLTLCVWLRSVQRAGDPCKCQTLKEKVLNCFSKDPSFLTTLIKLDTDFPVNSKFQFQFFLNHYFLQIFFLSCEFHHSHRALSLPAPLLSPPLTHTILSVMGVISLSISPSVPTINTHSPAPTLHLVCVFSLSLVCFDFTLFLSLLCPLYHVFSLPSHQRPEGVVWHRS